MAASQTETSPPNLGVRNCCKVMSESSEVQGGFFTVTPLKQVSDYIVHPTKKSSVSQVLEFPNGHT